ARVSAPPARRGRAAGAGAGPGRAPGAPESVVEPGEGTAEGCRGGGGKQAAAAESLGAEPLPLRLRMKGCDRETPAEPAPIWHAMSPDEVAGRLATDRRHGLSADEAARRLNEYGPNAVTPRKAQGRWRGSCCSFTRRWCTSWSL